jgi:hypothetical protein
VPTIRCLTFIGRVLVGIILIGVVTEHLSETLELNTSIDDGETLSEGGERTHQNMERDVSTRLEVRYGLATAAHALGNPSLGASAGLTLCPNLEP